MRLLGIAIMVGQHATCEIVDMIALQHRRRSLAGEIIATSLELRPSNHAIRRRAGTGTGHHCSRHPTARLS